MKFISHILLTLFIVGCTHNPSSNTPSFKNSDIVIKDVSQIELIKVRKRFDKYKPQVQIDIKNHSHETIYLEYQCTWFDSMGTLVRQGSSKLKPNPISIKGYDRRALIDKSYSDRGRKVTCSIRRNKKI